MSGGTFYPRVECPGGHLGGGTLHPMTAGRGLRTRLLSGVRETDLGRGMSNLSRLSHDGDK